MINEQKSSDKQFLDKWNINIDLVRENEEDVKLASLFKFNTVFEGKDEEVNRTEKRKSIETESIFEGLAKKKANNSNKSNNDKKQNSKDELRKKINKSAQNEKLISTGFSFNNLNDEKISKLPLKSSSPIVLIKKSNQSRDKEPSQSESYKSTSLSALVSNYDSSDDEK